MTNAVIAIASLLLIGFGVSVPYTFDRHPADWIVGAAFIIAGVIVGCVHFGLQPFGLFFVLTALVAIAAGKGWQSYRGGQSYPSFYAFATALALAITDIDLFPIIAKVMFWTVVVVALIAPTWYYYTHGQRARNAQNDN